MILSFDLILSLCCREIYLNKLRMRYERFCFFLFLVQYLFPLSSHLPIRFKPFYKLKLFAFIFTYLLAYT